MRSKKIKNIFKRIGKISVVLFFVAVAIMLCFVFGTQNEEIPLLLGSFFSLSMVMFLICIIAAWVLDLIEGMRINKASYFKEYVMQIIVFFIVCIVMDYFVDKIDGNWIGCLVRSAGMVCGIRAIEYIWSKEKC